VKVLRFLFGGPWLLILLLGAATVIGVTVMSSSCSSYTASEDAKIKARSAEALKRQHADADKAIREFQRSQLQPPAKAPVVPEEEIQ
jgi:hypothetical protein